MNFLINIYCDESCHLQNDLSDIMVLGAMGCDANKKIEVINDIRNIKIRNNLNSRFEIKWTKVSAGKIDFYKELIDYFFKNDFLFFRGLVACHKKDLDNKKYNGGDYTTWYYKMYFLLLNSLVYRDNEYRIFIDILDTHGGPRVKFLKKVLCNNIYDYKAEVIKDIYQINSKESEILQLADLLIGMIGYYNRGLFKKSKENNEFYNGKVQLIDYVKEKYKIDLGKSTDKLEKKYNLFIWNPKGWR